MNTVWLIMLIADLIVPITMIVVGCLYTKKPPKDINGFYGYRTHKSMQNRLTWNFAHKLIGKLWLTIGIVSLIITMFILALLFNRDTQLIAYTGIGILIVQIVGMICPIFVTEKALNERFK